MWKKAAGEADGKLHKSRYAEDMGTVRPSYNKGKFFRALLSGSGKNINFNNDAKFSKSSKKDR